MKMLYKLLLLFILSLTSFAQVRTSNRPPKIERFDFGQHILPRYSGNGLDSVTRYDFTVTMRDGVIIDALKFIPLGTPPSGGYPTVIMVHGYGDNKNTLAGFCRAQAQYGYYTATYSVRGQGISGGLSNLISKTEALDLIDFVNYIKRDSVSGSSPNNILIMGGSQGGLLPYMAACNGLNVKTIISALSPPDFASSWIENGCIKMTFLWTISYTPDTARYTPLVTSMSNWIYANNKPKWDSLAHWLPINRDFMSAVPNNHIPLIVEGTWQDKFFNSSGIIQGTTLLKAPYRMYVGAVQGHGGDHSPTEDQWHMQFFNDWFFYWLFGVQNGELTAPKYEYASTTLPIVNNWYTFVHDSSKVWPLKGVSIVKLYFNSSEYLDTIPNDIPSARVNLVNKVSGGLTMLQAVNDEFAGSDFTSKFKRMELVFDTDPLSSDLQMTGVPKVNLNYLSTGIPFCQYNFQLIELDPDGNEYFVTRINYTDRKNVKNSKRIAYFSGQGHSHIFKAGNQIRLKVTNLDYIPSDSSFFATNPFVLPVLINSSNYIYLNNQSFLELPLKGGILPTSPGISRTSMQKDNFRTVNKFSLSQNYPNPFNPTTNIKYQIPYNSFVKLSIYDILGKEVAVLVNGVQKEGEYNINFNASNLSSGIYFYKISAGSYQDVKKMIMVK